MDDDIRIDLTRAEAKALLAAAQLGAEQPDLEPSWGQDMAPHLRTALRKLYILTEGRY